MHFGDHAPPHFHAIWNGCEALIAISDGKVLAGYLPTSQLQKVENWRIRRMNELSTAWIHAVNREPVRKIAP